MYRAPEKCDTLMIRLMDPGSEASQGDKDGDGRVLLLPSKYGPLRCADVPLYDSVVDSHTHGLSFPPTLVVVLK